MMHPDESGNIRKIASERRHLEDGIWEEAFGVIRGASSGRILRRSLGGLCGGSGRLGSQGQHGVPITSLTFP